MPGPTTGGTFGGTNTTSNSNTFNIAALSKIPSIAPGDFLLVETPEGTRLIDFSNFLIGKPNVTFANELSALNVVLGTTTSLMSRTTASLFGGTGETLFLHSLSTFQVLTATNGVQYGDAGTLQNNGGIYTFNVPVSTTFTFADSGGNSDQWNSTYTNVNAMSGFFLSTFNTMTAASGNWENTHAAVHPNSGSWDQTYATVNANSGSWGGGSSKFTDGGDVTYLTSTSDRLAIGAQVGAQKLSVYGNISATGDLYSGTSSSVNWESTYTTVFVNSGTWSGGAADLTEIKPQSGFWNLTYTTSQDNSANWIQTHSTVESKSGKWQQTYNTVESNSADWNYTAANSGVSGFMTIATTGQDNIIAARMDTLTLSGMGIEITHAAGSNRIVLSGGASQGQANEFSFKTITVSAQDTNVGHQTDVVADTTTDTLTLCAGPNIALITDSTTDTVTISGQPGGGGGGTGAAEKIYQEITQSNSFSVGNAVYIKSDGEYAKAKADASSTAEVAGIITVRDGSSFTVVYAGEATVSSHGFTVGAALFLSSGTAGALTATSPSGTNVSKPVAIVKDANTLIVIQSRGLVGSGGGGGGGTGGHTIQYSGNNLTARTSLNFVSGGGVVDPIAEDDSGNDATNVTTPNGFDIMMITEVFR